MLRGGPTKAEIIAIASDKLQIEMGETFADIGCGTGSVSKAAARFTDKIIAVDKRSEAIEVARKTFTDAGVSTATLLLGEAPDGLGRIRTGDLRRVKAPFIDVISSVTSAPEARND
jgi:cobalt-precorrin-6B (C15)-methyltransferase